jgi:hypothetical protein
MRQRPQRPAGTNSIGAYLGAALRHCRRAAESNLRHGPMTDTAASVRRARDALERAAWVCDYATAEGDE